MFNTSSWPRTELVTLPKETKGNGVKDEQGRVVLSQRLSTGELVFLASDIPPFAARRFTIGNGGACLSTATKARGLWLESSALSLKLHPATGAIVTLRAGIGADLANVNCPINNYIYLPGGRVKDAQKIALRQIADKFQNIEFRLSANQNVILANVTEADKAGIKQELTESAPEGPAETTTVQDPQPPSEQPSLVPV